MKLLRLPIITLAIALTSALSSFAASPLIVNAADLIGKVYGVAEPAMSQEECRQVAGERFSDVPAIAEQAEWMGTDEGFSICYSGMTPESEGMARYENGAVAGYGYIFYFPYAAAARERANCEQCRFCSALLQELTDNGILLGADPTTDALFNVGGIFEGGDVQLTLREVIEAETPAPDMAADMIPADREGCFTLIISVVPAHALDYTADIAK